MTSARRVRKRNRLGVAVATDRSHEAEVFPLRLAATDIGSNAIRFLAEEFVDEENARVLEQLRVPVRLGHDVFLTGKLTEDAIDAAIKALKTFAERIDEHKIQRHRAVATSAVRESRNGAEFIKRVHDETGIEIEAITGVEEARLVHLAVRSRVALGRQKWLVADLGGGSVEISIVDQDAIYRSESHEMGAVRLLEELTIAGEEPGRFRRRLEEYTAALRNSPVLKTHVAGLVATGGNIEALAKLAGPEPNAEGVAKLTLPDLHGVIDRLASLSFNERVSEYGLRDDRADVILPAAMVYERIAVLAGADEIIVPNVGVKDGIVLDLLEQYAWRGRRHGSEERTVATGALSLGRKFVFDEAHARHVARLAASLFDQLSEIHEMSRDDRKLLIAAALLHDIGIFVAMKRHHKHSLYIIAQSELPGLTQDEVDIVANVARYHRKNSPSDNHEAFTKLSEKNRTRVVKLSALLRLADALDREHLQRVQSVRAEKDGGKLELTVTGKGDLLLERWALEKKAQLFEKVFDLSVKLEVKE